MVYTPLASAEQKEVAENCGSHISEIVPTPRHISFFKRLILWLCWVFVAACRLSLVEANGSHSSLWCMSFSLLWLLLLRSSGSRVQASVVAARGLSSCSSTWVGYQAHGLSCSVARGIFPDQGSNRCPLHWQADSYPLDRHLVS